MSGPIETPEFIALLRKYRTAGLANTVIAEKLGIGESTVRRWCIKHSLAKRPEPVALAGKRRDQKWPDKKLDQLRALRAQGLTFDAIAEQMGISKTSAVGKAAQMHLSKQKAPLPKPSPRAQRTPMAPKPKRVPVIEKPKAASGSDGWRLLPPGTPKPAQKPAAARDMPRGRSSMALEFTSFHCEECALRLFGSTWRIERLMADLVS